MIIEGLVNILVISIQSILSLIPNLPDLPKNLLEGANGFINLIFDNVGLLGLFIPVSTIKIVVPLILLIVNFDKIYRLVVWTLKKIPVFGIKG